MQNIKQQAFIIFDLLPEKEQALILELMKSLASDDIATPNDIATHNVAMEDYRRGETINHNDIDWS